MEPDGPLSPPEIAKLAGLSAQTIRRWIDAGVLRAERTVGNHRRVPRAEVMAMLKQRNSVFPAGLRGTRVLVIDDHGPFGKALKATLEASADVEVDVAESPMHGLLLAGVRRPGAVLLDAAMPGVDGYEVCRLMRTLPELMGTRIFGISGDPKAEAKFRAAGVDAFLLKPFNVAVVVEMLRLAGAVPTAPPPVAAAAE